METFTVHKPHAEVLEQMMELYSELFKHQGYGKMSVEMRFLKRGQKEILISCGKEYRYIVDFNDDMAHIASKTAIPA
ncbi:MAG: hypothetical protein R3Y11_02695 [Pseudomonadota bacterium]